MVLLLILENLCPLEHGSQCVCVNLYTLSRIHLSFFPDREDLCSGDTSILHDGNVNGASQDINLKFLLSNDVLVHQGGYDSMHFAGVGRQPCRW